MNRGFLQQLVADTLARCLLYKDRPSRQLTGRRLSAGRDSADTGCLMIEHSIGVRKKTIEVLEVNPDAFAAIEEEATSETGAGTQ